MTIDNVRPDPIRQSGTRPIREPYGDTSGPRPVRAADSVARVDRIEISDEARALAAQSAGEATRTEGTWPERIAEIQRRIENRFYDAPEVIDQVARRILARGDL
jgi:hypothetical protein